MEELNAEAKTVIREYAFLAEPRIKKFAQRAKLKFLARQIGVGVTVLLALIGIIAFFLPASFLRLFPLFLYFTVKLLRRYNAEKIYTNMDTGRYLGYKMYMESGNYRAALEGVYLCMTPHEIRSFVQALIRAGIDVKTPRDAWILLSGEYSRDWKSLI